MFGLKLHIFRSGEEIGKKKEGIYPELNMKPRGRAAMRTSSILKLERFDGAKVSLTFGLGKLGRI